ILVGLSALALANIAFHLSVAFTGSASEAGRLAISVYIMLIAIVGGRIVPSFTRNWLVKAGSRYLPASFDRFDVVALGTLLVSLLLWVVLPEHALTATAALLAAGL